jgi:hypothetical protein
MSSASWLPARTRRSGRRSLARCGNALKPNGKVLLAEPYVGDRLEENLNAIGPHVLRLVGHGVRTRFAGGRACPRCAGRRRAPAQGGGSLLAWIPQIERFAILTECADRLGAGWHIRHEHRPLQCLRLRCLRVTASELRQRGNRPAAVGSAPRYSRLRPFVQAISIGRRPLAETVWPAKALAQAE